VWYADLSLAASYDRGGIAKPDHLTNGLVTVIEKDEFRHRGPHRRSQWHFRHRGSSRGRRPLRDRALLDERADHGTRS
jgi:hypothetical protein